MLQTDKQVNRWMGQRPNLCLTSTEMMEDGGSPWNRPLTSSYLQNETDP